MDRDDTLPNTLAGVHRWLEDGWQHLRRLPAGPMMRVPRRFWMYNARNRHYPLAGRLRPDRENEALSRVVSSDSYLREEARTLP